LIETLAGYTASTTPIAFEAHGTGTALGDPIEVGAILSALCGTDALTTVQCASLKANIGHLESAAAGSGIFVLLVATLN